MWYPVSDEVSEEAVSLPDAKAHRKANSDANDDQIGPLVLAARAHVEVYCNQKFAKHVMVWGCDSFADFACLPAAPASLIMTIEYVDPAGDTQALDESIFILRADGLDPKIVLRPAQTWPQIQSGSRITVTGVFGGNCPKDVHHAIKLLIGDGDAVRENSGQPLWSAVDVLLANHRRGAW